MTDSKLPGSDRPEPWLRRTGVELPAVSRAVVHALELAEEDIERWCSALTDNELNARPSGVAPVSFHLRHIARSIDRLLTYAEGKSLDERQMGAMKSELEGGATRAEAFAELKAGVASATARVGAIAALGVARLEYPRAVGRRQLPTTVGGLLVHVADHTQRHVGQAITTAKIVMAGRA